MSFLGGSLADEPRDRVGVEAPLPVAVREGGGDVEDTVHMW